MSGSGQPSDHPMPLDLPAPSAPARRRHRRAAIAAVIAVILLLVSAVGYGAAGAYVYSPVLRVDAHCGGRFADHDPGHWDTQGISAEFTVNLDPTPYLMPDFTDVTFPSRDAKGYSLHAWWIRRPRRRRRRSSLSTARAAAGAIPCSCCRRGCSTAMGSRCSWSTSRQRRLPGRGRLLRERHGGVPRRPGRVGLARQGPRHPGRPRRAVRKIARCRRGDHRHG